MLTVLTVSLALRGGAEGLSLAQTAARVGPTMTPLLVATGLGLASYETRRRAKAVAAFKTALPGKAVELPTAPGHLSRRRRTTLTVVTGVVSIVALLSDVVVANYLNLREGDVTLLSYIGLMFMFCAIAYASRYRPQRRWVLPAAFFLIALYVLTTPAVPHPADVPTSLAQPGLGDC